MHVVNFEYMESSFKQGRIGRISGGSDLGPGSGCFHSSTLHFIFLNFPLTTTHLAAHIIFAFLPPNMTIIYRSHEKIDW